MSIADYTTERVPVTEIKAGDYVLEYGAEWYIESVREFDDCVVGRALPMHKHQIIENHLQILIEKGGHYSMQGNELRIVNRITDMPK